MVDDMKHGMADRDGGRDGAGGGTPVQRTEINILRIWGRRKRTPARAGIREGYYSTDGGQRAT